MREVDRFEMTARQHLFYRRHLVMFWLTCGHTAPRIITGSRPISSMPTRLKCHVCESRQGPDDC
jgi:hypothetical protein